MPLDHTDEVWAGRGTRARQSTLTGLRQLGSDVLVLVSGHGVLPFDGNGRIVTDFEAGGSETAAVTINDGAGGFFEGLVLAGAFGAGQCRDWAIVKVPNMSEELYDAWHAAAGRGAPFRLRTEPISAGLLVWHVSRLPHRPQRAFGRVVDPSLPSADVRVSDDSLRSYANVIRVDGARGLAFSVEGESGSLVVDDEQRVVGTVVAGNGQVSYVLPGRALAQTLAARGFHDFLEEE